MSYRCVVVDDERPARNRLKRMLAPHADFEVVGEAADAASAVELIDRERPDFCFLDVKMPEGDGFEVLERVEHMPHVIFTTAFDEFAVRAFEVHSLDYLLKPFSRKRFDAALDRAREAMRRQASAGELRGLLEEIRARPQEPPARISGRRGAKIVLLDPAEIMWFEAEDTLVFAHGGEGRFLIERTLADLEEQFTPAFFRAHRRYLVNLSQVAEILPGDAGTYRMVMKDEDRSVVTLSRRQARKLREFFPW